jgi:hypothetical protein
MRIKSLRLSPGLLPLHRHLALTHLVRVPRKWLICCELAAGLKKAARSAEAATDMPYVKRNTEGRVISLSDESDDACNEELELAHPDVRAFLETARQALTSSDSETIRVIEDLIDVLVQKKLILLTDLPHAAQMKLTERQRMRNEINVLDNLMVGEDDIL